MNDKWSIVEHKHVKTTHDGIHRFYDIVDHMFKNLTEIEADIEEMTRQPVSIMPDGLDQKLSRAQLRDLLAYLKSLK